MIRYSVRTGASVVELNGRHGSYRNEAKAHAQAKRLTKAHADGVDLAPPVAQIVAETGHGDETPAIICTYKRGRKVAA